jgi:hypothetical protein
MTTAAAILLLVGIAAGARLGGPRPSHVADTRIILKTYQQALVHWQADNEATCPADAATLASENYLLAPPRDAWGHPLRFRCPGVHNTDGADLSSAGADGVFDTADDIRSWEP